MTTENNGLRVLVCGIVWPPETFLAQLIRGLIESGVDVTIASASKPDAGWLARPRFHWLPTPNWGGPALARIARLSWMAAKAATTAFKDTRSFASYIAQDEALALRLQSWHRLLPFAGKRWDLIYFPWNSAAIAYQPLFDTGCPVVISCRGSQINVAPHNPKRIAFRQGLKTIFHRATAVHCVSEAIKQNAMSYGLDSEKAQTIYPAVDPDFFKPSGQNAQEGGGEFRVLATGTLIWFKGYEYALQAIRNLIDRGIAARFDIIGDGPERQRVVYSIHDMRLQNHVTLHGKMSPEKVRDYLHRADAFLLGSVTEGISNSVLEAMSCGVPVVTTDCGGMTEAVTDGVEGLVVAVRDPQAIADALARLATDADLRQSLGEAGRERVLRQFSIAQQVRKFLSLYDHAIGAGN